MSQEQAENDAMRIAAVDFLSIIIMMSNNAFGKDPQRNKLIKVTTEQRGEVQFIAGFTFLQKVNRDHQRISFMIRFCFSFS